MFALKHFGVRLGNFDLGTCNVSECDLEELEGIKCYLSLSDVKLNWRRIDIIEERSHVF